MFGSDPSMEHDFVSIDNIGASTEGGESKADDGASIESSCGGQRTVWMQLNRNGTKNLSSVKEGEAGLLVVIWKGWNVDLILPDSIHI